MPLPRILVLLATYQGSTFIDQQLSSILWQVGVDVSVLVRDDGSTDRTVEICQDWADRYPGRVTLLRDGERSGSPSRNFLRLIAAAPLNACDYVALADQDDVWLPDKLRCGVEAMQAENAEGYSCDMLAFDETGRAAWLIGKSGEQADLDYLFQGASAGCTYVLSTTAVRTVREVMAQPEVGWVHHLSYDWTIYAICRSRGMGWVRDPRPGLLYRQHASNDYGARAGFRGLLQRVRSTRAGWYRDHVAWLRNVVALNEAEREVFDALDCGDRRWLARNAGRFRRIPRDARLLALAFVTRLF